MYSVSLLSHNIVACWQISKYWIYLTKRPCSIHLKNGMEKLLTKELYIFLFGAITSFFLLCFLTFVRHRGRSPLGHILPACGWRPKTLLTAAMAGLLLYLTRHSLQHKGQIWELVALVPALYAMLKSLGVLVRCRFNKYT